MPWSASGSLLLVGVLLSMPSSVQSINGCELSLALESKTSLAAMALATGKMIPFDAGKINMCEGFNDLETPILTKFFLVTMMVESSAGGIGGMSGLPMELGICLPAACTDQDVMEMPDLIANRTGQFGVKLVVPKYALGYPQPPSTVPHINPSNQEDDLKPWSVGATIACCVVFAFMAWTLLATGITMLARQSDQRAQAVPQVSQDTGAANAAPLVAENWHGLALDAQPDVWQKLAPTLPVRAWCLVGDKGSWKDLWTCPAYRPTDCLNGIRVLSMLCIVVGHSFGMSENNVGFDNPLDIMKSPVSQNAAETNLSMVFIMNPEDMAVDSFFFISGFLLAFTTRRRATPIVKGAVLRYLRIVPSVAFMTMLYGWISPYLMHGPFAPRAQESILRKCETGWWVNLVYVMNFYPRNAADICAGWTWYLGNDFVFYIIGLILVNIWQWKRGIAWSWVGLLTVGSFASSMVIIFHYNLGTYLTQGPAYQYYLYEYPWHRIPPFLVGLGLPWVLDSLQRRGLDRNPNAPKTLAARVAWVGAATVAFGVMWACVFLPELNYNGGAGSTRTAMNWSKTANALFLTFVRPMWAVCLGVITLACYYGYLPLCDGALSHWVWHPLSKLTYGAYLLHPIIIKQFAGNMTSYFHYSLAEVYLHAWGHGCLAYGASIVLFCIVEKPCSVLVDAVVPKQRAPAVQETQLKQPLPESNGQRQQGAGQV